MLLAIYAITLVEVAISTKTKDEDIQVLYDIHTYTNGTDWLWTKNMTTWNFVDSDPCENLWFGISCNCDEKWCRISKIQLSKMNLNGQLPPSVKTLNNLEVFEVANNMISGEIPTFLSSAATLKALDMSYNFVCGTFPESLVELTYLKTLNLIGNSITGSIPSNIGVFYQAIEEIFLGENSFSGTLPSSLGDLIHLSYLYVTKNKLQGTIPDSFSKLTNLYYLGLSTNHFSKSIPSSIFEHLNRLEYLMVNGNKISGTLPSVIGYMTSLHYFEMNENKLHGSIPSSIGDMTRLVVFELCENDISGRIPSSIGKLVNLESFFLDGNQLTGPIPPEIGYMKTLKHVLFYSNSLSGSLPETIGYLSQLEELSLYDNYFTGLVPGCITKLPNIKQLLLQCNFFFGFECVASSATSLLLPHGSYTHSNSNAGCTFDMPHLERIDISDNNFGGKIPGEIFKYLPSLISFAAVANCFTGSLPDSICDAKSLEIMAMDGLGSGIDCRKEFYDPLNLMHSYMPITLEVGTIPECIWKLENLTVLHLSGNGLTGKLPEMFVSEKLSNFSVAFNRMSGTIPHFIQRWPFVELCLGYNKLSGLLISTLDFDDSEMLKYESKDSIGTRPYTILSLTSNRLSGYLPQHMDNVLLLDSLVGNLFMCDDSHPLPSNDPNKPDYICGSECLDQSLLAWMCTLFVVLLASGVAFYVYKLNTRKSFSNNISSDSKTYTLITPIQHDNNNDDDIYTVDENGNTTSIYYHKDYEKSNFEKLTIFVSNCCMWYSACHMYNPSESFDSKQDEFQVKLPNLRAFLSLLAMLRRAATLMAVIIFLICTPAYSIFKYNYDEFSTHDRQYGWTYSGAFLSGYQPAIFLSVMHGLLSCFMAYSFIMLYPKSVADGKSLIRQSMMNSSSNNHSRQSLLVKHYNLNIQVCSMSDDDVSAGNSSLSLLNDVEDAVNWKQYMAKCFVYTFLFLANALVTLVVNGAYVYVLSSDASASYAHIVKSCAKVVLACFFLAWNMVVIPISVEHFSRLVNDVPGRVKWLSTLLLVFSYIIAPTFADIMSSNSCFGEAFDIDTEVKAYYSYPVCRVYNLDINDGTRTCVEYSSADFFTSYSPPFMYSYQCVNNIMTNFIPVYLLQYTYLTLVPAILTFLFSFTKSSQLVPNFIIRMIPYIVWPSGSSISYCGVTTSASSTGAPLIRPDRMISSLMNHFTVLLTFGIISPFLAVAIGTAICVVTFLAELLIGRHLHYFRFQRNSKEFNGDLSGGLEQACNGVLRGLPSSLWVIISVASIFFTMLVLDIASDKIMWENGIWYALPVLLVPMAAYATLRFTLKYVSYESNHD